jgi:hypothetical protein
MIKMGNLALLQKILVLSAAITLILSPVQDFLDPGRSRVPSVAIKSVAQMVMGVFLIYFWATVMAGQ